MMERIHAAQVMPAMLSAAVNFWASGIVAITSLDIPRKSTCGEVCDWSSDRPDSARIKESWWDKGWRTAPLAMPFAEIIGLTKGVGRERLIGKAMELMIVH